MNIAKHKINFAIKAIDEQIEKTKKELEEKKEYEYFNPFLEGLLAGLKFARAVLPTKEEDENE